MTYILQKLDAKKARNDEYFLITSYISRSHFRVLPFWLHFKEILLGLNLHFS
jgi:hypothetical protein